MIFYLCTCRVHLVYICNLTVSLFLTVQSIFNQFALLILLRKQDFLAGENCRVMFILKSWKLDKLGNEIR